MIQNTLKCSYFEALYLCKAYIPFAFLALIPTIIARPETLFRAVIAYGANLIFVTVIFIYGVLSAANKRLEKTPSGLCFYSGIIKKRAAFFTEENIKSLIIEKSVFSRLFNKSRVILNTGSKAGKKGKFSMFIKGRNERTLTTLLFGRKSSFKTVYKASLRDIFFMAVSSSNAFAGIVIFLPFLNKTGQLFGEHYKALLYSSLDLSPQIESAGIPSASAGIGGILIMGLIVSVVSVILSYGFFRVEQSQSGGVIIIKRGIIERRLFVTRISDISAFQLRQSLLMSVLKRCSLKFFTPGQHREKQSKRIIMPYIHINSGEEFLKVNRSKEAFAARPPKSALKSYLYFPITLISLLCLFCLAGSCVRLDTVPIYPLIIFTLAILIIHFIMRIFARKKAFLYADGKKAVISFYQRLSFIKTLVPLEKISSVKITQSIFQRRAGLCNVYVYALDENKRRFKIKHLKLSDGMKFKSKVL